jgi:hypothetical protein
MSSCSAFGDRRAHDSGRHQANRRRSITHEALKAGLRLVGCFVVLVVATTTHAFAGQGWEIGRTAEY